MPNPVERAYGRNRRDGESWTISHKETATGRILKKVGTRLGEPKSENESNAENDTPSNILQKAYQRLGTGGLREYPIQGPTLGGNSRKK